MKYKIEINQGCTAYGTVVNGKDWSGEYPATTMTEEERNEFYEYLLSKIKEGYDDGSICIDDLIRLFHYDGCSWGPVCDQCGDSVMTESWEL